MIELVNSLKTNLSFRTKHFVQIAEKIFFKRINRLVECVTCMLNVISLAWDTTFILYRIPITTRCEQLGWNEMEKIRDLEVVSNS